MPIPKTGGLPRSPNPLKKSRKTHIHAHAYIYICVIDYNCNMCLSFFLSLFPSFFIVRKREIYKCTHTYVYMYVYNVCSIFIYKYICLFSCLFIYIYIYYIRIYAFHFQHSTPSHSPPFTPCRRPCGWQSDWPGPGTKRPALWPHPPALHGSGGTCWCPGSESGSAAG